MIIKFDRTPEERYRLSREAFARGELDRALLYGEDAVRGKGSQEYKVSRAEILMAMGRYADAADVALDALCFGVGERAEIYEILARAASELGHFYESLHFFAKRAHFEGDEDTLDAMDEVIEEIDAEQERRRDRDFFVVGKEDKPKSADPTLILQANFALDHGDWLGAIRYASEVEKGSEHYVEARTICLRAHLKRREKEVAELIAEEIISLDEKNGFALYILIDRFKRKEYIPLLSAMEKEGSDVYYAILAAESIADYSLARRLVKRLLEVNRYVPGAYFVAASVALNGGDKKESEEHLRALFSLYRKYPQEVILKGWRRISKCDTGFSGRMPVAVVRILENYVKRNARNAEDFLRSMLTDESFRAALLLVLEEGKREIVSPVISYLKELNDRHVDAFFSKVLIRYEVDLLVKREIFAALYYRKERGRLFVTQSVVPVRVSCTKPPKFASYPPALRLAYAEVFSFVTCMTDAACEGRLCELAARIAERDGEDTLFFEVICGAFLYRLLEEKAIPVDAEASSSEDACRFFLQFVFGIRRVNMAKVRLLAAAIAE